MWSFKKKESCNARKYYVCHTKKYNLQPESKFESKIITETKKEAELLIKKSDNNRIRQTKDIIYEDGKFKIIVDEQGVANALRRFGVIAEWS